MKRSFDSNDRYTAEAMELDRRAQVMIQPLFDEFMRLGYSVREISHIVMLAVFDCEMMSVLDRKEPT